MSSNIPIIGIDLGTTFSCVATIAAGGQAEVITVANGKNLIPSKVAYTDDEVIVGEAATNCVVSKENLIFDSKRLIGRQFNDDSVQADMKLWPFKVVNKQNRPFVSVRRNGSDETHSPEQISAEILKTMKEIAQNYTTKEVNKVVITVPANFNMKQRHATLDAARLAGINVLRLVNEPTAAAIAYGIHNEGQKNVLVFDYGGGTLDVSIVKCNGNGRLEVIATAGHTHCGGQDIDAILMHFAISQYRNGRFPIDKPKLLARLRDGCTKAKELLSSSKSANISVDMPSSNGLDENDLNITITRNKFNELCGDTFRGTFLIVDEALSRAEMKVADIDIVVLSGGSTLIPMIQDLLREKFGQSKLWRNINPTEIVAKGAALVAKSLLASSNGFNIEFNDIAPLSLGRNLKYGLMETVIPRGTKYPCKKVVISYIPSDNQTKSHTHIYEGERKNIKYNVKIGEIEFSLIDSKVRWGDNIKDIFEIDDNGLLKVTSIEVKTGKFAEIEIAYNGYPFTEKRIENILMEAKEHEEEDKHFESLCRKGYGFSLKIYDVKHEIEDSSSIDDDSRENALKIINRYIEWNKTLHESIEYEEKSKEFDVEIKRYMDLLSKSRDPAADSTNPIRET